MASSFIKDPDAVLDYKWDWSDWLDTGETISSHTIAAVTGITKDSSALTDTNTSVTAWYSGGTALTDYEVTCQIVTSDSRTDERTITLKVRER
jgi:hypothetical protein